MCKRGGSKEKSYFLREVRRYNASIAKPPNNISVCGLGILGMNGKGVCEPIGDPGISPVGGGGGGGFAVPVVLAGGTSMTAICDPTCESTRFIM